MSLLPDIDITRTGERFTVMHNGAAYEGIRSVLRCGSLSDHYVIERGNNRVHLPPGLYRCQMTHWVSRRTGRSARSIVYCEELSGVVLTQKQQQELNERDLHMHPANWPYQLEGCQAQGLTAYSRGVRHSAKAMRRMFDALGGFEEGRDVIVQIATQVAEDFR